MKSAAGLLRSLVRTGTRQSKSVNKLMTALFKAATPPAPKRKRAPAAKVAKVAKPAAKKGADPVRGPTPKPATRAIPGAGVRVERAARAAKPVAPAPHIPPAPGKWLASHYPMPAGVGKPAQRMSYWLYLPDHVPEQAARKGLPLVVMLHGCQQTATQFAQGTRMNHWAERMGCAVLYPQQLVSSHPQRCWKWYDRATQEGGGDVPAIVGMLHKVMTEYAIDRSRVYIAGISAGAGMANIVALNHPRLFAAVGLHSGPVYGAGHSTMGALGVMRHGGGVRADMAVREVMARQPHFPGMPTILIQGEGDSVVRPINQAQLAKQSMALNGLGAVAEPKVTQRARGRGGRHNAHRIDDFYAGRKLLLRVARIEQLEHAWSGGDEALAYNAKAGPDASKMMMEFFARHHRA
ncbi:MAG TPA: PHB depolymerase family esterase [Duganella sp.]|uniref:extracellular catalytic domain type 1 short-chain-length polyhydroxyalkanoate depolymerase n=1 Tax=Duganella sp. TaxID=1904440 RepID=UPI002ED1D1B9